ncbi:MAG TPA: carboxypeptidase-like regulatory domain-containing protein [Sunxiuqinia sp.]|nr:carboxypeptidase-like regulatory domain-containing protein [Sunxiuqinia sp.]
MKLLFFLLFSLAATANGQTTLKGTVRDSTDHQPIPYATVYINGTMIGTITDTNGHFQLKKVLVICN